MRIIHNITVDQLIELRHSVGYHHEYYQYKRRIKNSPTMQASAFIRSLTPEERTELYKILLKAPKLDESST